MFLLPTSSLDLKGLATYEVFLRGTLDKIGAFPDLLHIGDYKTAMNTFTEKTLHAGAPRDDRVAQHATRSTSWCRASPTARKKTADEVRALIDQGPFNPEDALSAGLVDDLAYATKSTRRPASATRRRAPSSTTTRAPPATASRFGRGDRIAVIYAVGTISSGDSGEGPDGTYAGLGHARRLHRRTARGRHDVKAVVLRVDSPGGSSIASDVIWRELMLDARKEAAHRLDVGSRGVGRLLHRHARRTSSSPSPAR